MDWTTVVLCLMNSPACLMVVRSISVTSQISLRVSRSFLRAAYFDWRAVVEVSMVSAFGNFSLRVTDVVGEILFLNFGLHRREFGCGITWTDFLGGL